MAKIKPMKTEIGTVPVKYSENVLFLHETMASGKIDGVEYEVHNAFGFMYIQFSGKKKLKGSLAKIQIDVEDFVQSAYKIAKEKKLLIK